MRAEWGEERKKHSGKGKKEEEQKKGMEGGM